MCRLYISKIDFFSKLKRINWTALCTPPVSNRSHKRPCGSLSLRILIPYIWPAYDHNRLVNLFRLLGCHFLLGFSASCYSLIHKYFKKKSDKEDHAHLCALLFLLKCWPLQSWCLWTFLFAMLSFYFGGGRGKTVSSRQDDFSDKEFCHS